MANTIVINETPRYSLSVTGSEELQLSVAGGNELQVTLNGPAGPVGPTGATGATGAAGPNSVTTSTSSNLTGFISANGTNVSGATAGATAATANTLALRDGSGGSNFAAVGASSVTSSGAISTTGDSTISTSGENAYIQTEGDNATISTYGSDASIYTGGSDASIFTDGANAYIQSRSTFKLYNGTYTTTLSHAATADRAIAFPNKAGTVAMIDAETHTGAHAFSSTTRPTSAGTGTPAATSLITTADGDARYGSSVQFVMGSDAAITAATFANVTGATVALEASSNYSFEGFLHIEALAALSRVQCRLAYTGTLQTVQGVLSCPQTNGSVFAMATGALLTTGFADVSSLDRVFHLSGFIRTSTAGTLTLTSYRVSGSGSPTIKAGSQMRFRKL